jgi:hypothetical protein
MSLGQLHSTFLEDKSIFSGKKAFKIAKVSAFSVF